MEYPKGLLVRLKPKQTSPYSTTGFFISMSYTFPKKLRTEYESIVNDYIKQFQRKHDCEFEFWIGEQVGGIASFGDINCISFLDVVHDLHSNAPIGLIFNWIEDTTDEHFKAQEQFREENYINFQSYCMGARYEMLNN